MEWPGTVASEALFVDHFRRCCFRLKIKYQLFGGRVLAVVRLRSQLGVCVRLA
jgi:hypothetical protein